jgi:hypothetical protein
MRTAMILAAALGAACLAAAAPRGGQDPAKLKLKEALKDTEPQGDWIYDDLPAGIAEAKKANKPMLIVFR